MYKYKLIKKMFILVTILFFISGVFLPAERGTAERSIELKVNDANEAEVQTPSEPIIIPDNEISITETMNEFKEIKKEENSKQGLSKFRSMKDLRNGDEFSFGGRMWVMINPNDGFAMMKDSISTINLEQVKLDNANEILEYFDTIYYNQLSPKDKELMESMHFGLTKLEESFYITMYFKSAIGLKGDGSLGESNSIVGQVKITESKRDSLLYFLIVSMVFFGGLLMWFVFKK